MLGNGCVLDASVLLKLVLPEVGSDQAAGLVADLLGRAVPCMYAPDRLYLECANVLMKRVRVKEICIAEAEASLVDLLGLDLIVFPSEGLVVEALALAAARGLAVYDAAYAVVARRLGVPLVTADERLVRALEGSGIQAVPLRVVGASGARSE